MQLKKTLFLTLFFVYFFTQNIYAQYSRGDSLRGALSPLRTCYDVLHYDLYINVKIDKKFIEGKNTITYKVVEDFKKLQVDLFENMNIESISQNGKNLTFKREGNATFVEFSEKQTKNSTQKIEIKYNGYPRPAVNAPWDGGFSWKKDSKGKDWVGVSCEGLGASVWFPNKDHLSDEPDSVRVVAEVPKGLICVSNGNLKQKTEKENTTQFDWRVSYPINNYNITLNIAEYVHFSEEYTAEDGEKMPLDYYVLPENLEKAKKQFLQVKPMLACYEKLFGKYPFWKDGFALVETPYLGMEHQGAIAYGNKYRNGYLGSDISGTGEGLFFDYIIIHETGHEYWGNNISCSDHAEMWIHESFCTYTEGLYVECMKGKEAGYNYLGGYFGQGENQKPLIGDLDVNADGHDIYGKGASILHTLRNVVEDDKKWFAMLKNISKDFRHKVVNTKMMTDYMNKALDNNYDYFFNQYLKTPNVPILEYKITKQKGKHYLEYRWRNTTNDFKMPINVLFNENSTKILIKPTANTWQKIPISKAQTNITLPKNHYFVNLQKVE